MKEALAGEDGDLRLKAATEEYANLIELEVFTLEKRPKDCKLAGSKWVLKTKPDAEGFAQRYKVRFVAKGLLQVPGTDFNMMFAPVGQGSITRAFLAVAANRNYDIYQLDIKAAALPSEMWMK